MQIYIVGFRQKNHFVEQLDNAIWLRRPPQINPK
jgi:hypothetical protein